MYEDITKDLHKLADAIESTENLPCFSNVRKAAYLITALEADNEQLRAQLFKLWPTPRERLYRFLGYFYFKYITLKKIVKKGKDTGTFWNGITRYWTMKAKQ